MGEGEGREEMVPNTILYLVARTLDDGAKVREGEGRREWGEGAERGREGEGGGRERGGKEGERGRQDGRGTEGGWSEGVTAK